MTAPCSLRATCRTDSTPPPSTVPKPPVSLPTTMPTSLVTTVVTPGSGTAAASGDVVVVNYVGERSLDGTEFDNSYDKGAPLPVKLGAGNVIKGWDDGLVGVQAGERLQLDIPADLAYGDTPQGEIIQPGDALSFVIDVVAVVPAVTAADEPQITVTGAPNREDLVIDDLVDGTGATLQDGQTAVLQLAWPIAATPVSASTARGRRKRPADRLPLRRRPVAARDRRRGQGHEGRGPPPGDHPVRPGVRHGRQHENLGIPGNTDVVLVLDLVAAY